MMTFFIAEDDPLMIRLYERAFKLAGHEIVIAKDGDEALIAIAGMSVKPSVIILDVMMPKVSGFDVLQRLKQDEATKNIPVVMLTNLAGEEDKQKGLSLGAVDYMIKSDYSPEEVVKRVTGLVA